MSGLTTLHTVNYCPLVTSDQLKVTWSVSRRFYAKCCHLSKWVAFYDIIIYFVLSTLLSEKKKDPDTHFGMLKLHAHQLSNAKNFKLTIRMEMYYICSISCPCPYKRPPISTIYPDQFIKLTSMRTKRNIQ